MGVPVRLECVVPPGVDAFVLWREVSAEMNRLERVVNLWDSGSELARWNAGPARGGRVSLELSGLVRRALGLCAETGGVFDPTVGSVLAGLGHYGDASGAEALEPSPGTTPGESRALGCALVRLVEGAGDPFLERDDPGVRLDLSALAKGWAAERVALLLRERGVRNAYLDLGSSTALAIGPGPDGRGWEFRIPGEGGATESWWLVDEAVSTSGRAAEPALPGGIPASQLIDPRTGAPLPRGPLLVITRGPDALLCDAWSTTIAVQGSAAGLAPPVQVHIATATDFVAEED